MNDVLDDGPPSIENNAHCEAFTDGVFPKKATDVPAHHVQVSCNFTVVYLITTRTLKLKVNDP
jgi:hypothetical protein